MKECLHNDCAVVVECSTGTIETCVAGKVEGDSVGGYFPEDAGLEMASPRDLQSPNPAGGLATLGGTPTAALQDKNARKKVALLLAPIILITAGH